MQHMVGVEHSLKMSAPQLFWFGIDSVLNILNVKDQVINLLMNDKGVYRTAPATPDRLKMGYVTMF